MPKQGTGESCENPWSGIFVGCDPKPEPKSCTDPLRHAVNDLGDPVDLTTGALAQDATDLDLGHGLTFRRHYASNRGLITEMGKDWRHSFDWRVRYGSVGTAGTNGYQEVVMVERPLATNVAFERNFWSLPYGWKGGERGAGGLSGEAGEGFTFIDEDGTRVHFEPVDPPTSPPTFELTEIRMPGEPAIAVSRSGAVTTYSNGAASLAIIVNASGPYAGRVASVTGGGQTWSYTYHPTLEYLLTVTGPDLSTPSPSDTVVWTYTYSGLGRLTKLERTVAGSTATLGEWTYGSYFRVSSMDERGLDQKLYLAYTPKPGNPANVLLGTHVCDTATACEDPTSPLASYTITSDRIDQVTGSDAPGLDVPFSDVSFTVYTPDYPAPQHWKTVRDERGNKTLYEDHDERGRPGRVVTGWVDANQDDTLDPGESRATDRSFTYHPRLAGALSTTEASVLNSSGSRAEILDYDDDLDTAPNESPTDRVYRRVQSGWTLDASGNQVAFADTTDYAYDTSHRLIQIKGPYTGSLPDPYSGPLTAITYDATTGSRSALRRYPAGSSSAPLEWTFSSFDPQGNPQTVTDPNGRATAFTYDGLGRVLTATPPCETTVCANPADAKVTFTYDVDGNLTKVQFPDDTAGADVFLEFGYDTAKPDLLRFLKDAHGNAIVYTYQKGRVVREERYTSFVSLQSMGTRAGDASFSYDAAGRMIAAFNPLFSGGNVSSAFLHDAKGNVTGISDENATHAAGVLDPLRKDTLGYDALDRLLSIAQVRGATTTTTSFEYDALSNVTQVTDAASKTTDLLHDDRGNLVETVSPDTGRTRFVYDAAGNLVTKIENAPETGTSGARITSYTYDGLNRPTGINLSNDADVDWIFTYDTDAAKNQKGRLAQVTNGVVTTKLEYTQRGDVALERTQIDGSFYDVLYEYDAAGNRKRIQAPSLDAVTTSYAGLRPSKLSISAGARTEEINQLAWYPFGPRLSAKLPPDDPNGNTVTSTRTVNLRGQITEIDVTRPGTALVDRSYVYDHTAGGTEPDDPGPNLDRMIDQLDAAESRSYFYDELDRLEKATNLAGTTTLHQYSYDAVGNRQTKLGSAGTTSYSYESLEGLVVNNRLDAATAPEARDYHHDVYGNRDYDGADPYGDTPSLLYDEANRLIEVRDPADSFATLATYTYDAFGRRVKKVVGGATVLYFYDTEGHLIGEVQKLAAADLSRTYVFLEDELMAVIDKTKEVGTAAFVMPLGGSFEIDPRLLFGALLALAGIGAGLATRRAPVGIATTTSGAALLLLCAGTPQQPRMAFVHVDPLGTPIAITNAPATWNANNPAKVVWKASYEPFGQTDPNEDPDGDGAMFPLNVRFPGQYEDAETGYHSNMRRDYDPATGRYLETDPAGLSGGFALYPYARGNPIRFLDRNGAAPEDGSGVGNPFWFGWGLPTPEEHFRRNRNNRCPARPPENCEGWSKDPTWYAPSKFRHADGYECAYDDFGNLLPDATSDSGTQNYSFNYAPGGGSFLGEFFTPRHLWQDVFPHFFYGGQYPPALTQPLKGCGCEK